MGVACIPIRLKTSILFDREVATRALPIPSAGPDAPHLPKSHRHPRESGGPASVDANPLADSLADVCEKHPAVYILASRYRGTLYAGVTSSLWQRVWDHRNGRFDGFTAKYSVKTLVW